MTLWQFLEHCEAEFLARLLAQHNGNARSAAKEAGIHRATLYKRLHKHKLLTPRVYGNSEWRASQ